jgi:hypothetical protein
MFLIQRSLLSAMFIPHEDFTPQKYVHSSTGGVQRGGTPSAGSGGPIPPIGGFGGKRAPREASPGGFGGEAPEGKIAL